METLSTLRGRLNSKYGYHYTDNDYQKLFRGPYEIYDHKSLALNGVTFKTRDADGNTIATYCNIMYHEQAGCVVDEDHRDDQLYSSSPSTSSSSSSMVLPSKKRKPRPARQAKENRIKRRKTSKKKAKMNKRGKSPVPSDSEDDDDDNHDEADKDEDVVHSDYCSVCNDGGNLLMFDGIGCARSYHLECTELIDEPEGDFLCPRWCGIIHHSRIHSSGFHVCFLFVV